MGRGSPASLSNEIADTSLRRDSTVSAVTSGARWWSNHAGGDEVRKAMFWCVEWTESGDRTTPIGDDDLVAGLHAIDVLAEAVLELADPDLRPRSSYVHGPGVATSIAGRSLTHEAVPTTAP